MTKPEPNDVTCRGVVALGPRKFLNRSANGEPGGSCGICWLGAFKVWEVEMLTTVGSNFAERSAKDSGAPRAHAGAQIRARTAQSRAEKRICLSWAKRATRIRPSIAIRFRRKQGHLRR